MIERLIDCCSVSAVQYQVILQMVCLWSAFKRVEEWTDSELETIFYKSDGNTRTHNIMTPSNVDEAFVQKGYTIATEFLKEN